MMQFQLYTEGVLTTPHNQFILSVHYMNYHPDGYTVYQLMTKDGLIHFEWNSQFPDCILQQNIYETIIHRECKWFPFTY